MFQQKETQKIDLSRHKSEIYDHVQNKLKQITQAYSPKFTNINQQIEQIEEKLQKVVDVKNDQEFQFEEFKDIYNLKLKLQ